MTIKMYIVTNMSISNRCCKGKKKSNNYHVSTKDMKQHKCFLLIIIRHVSWAANQHIIMISEDWSNDAENTALITEINYIWTYIHMENGSFKLKIIVHNIEFLQYFCLINVSWWA